MAKQNNLGAIICPNCGRMISASAETCIHCGTRNPNLWGMASTLRKIFGGHTSLMPIVVATCIALYVLSLLIDPQAIMHPQGLFGILAPSSQSLFKLGMTGAVPVNNGRWWTLITAIYLHGGLLHIFFNVMWIRQLGPAVEEFFGISRSFIIFTLSGVLGFVFSTYAGHAYTLGASGSIFGLLGALIYYGRKRGGTFGSAIYRQLGQWAIVLFIFGLLFPIVDNYAHAGGFIGGYLGANVLGFIEIKRENRSHQMVALGLMGLTIFAFLLSILN